MNAVTKIADTDAQVQPDDVLIHVRFLPSAEIFSIDARPDAMSARDWFERLYMGAPQHYQVRAGGRGFFRIPRLTFEALATRKAA